MSDVTLFQYCQKIVLFRNDDSEVLLARRTGEADYNQTYAFIGGKIETTDGDILEGLRREKNEEIGHRVRIRMCPFVSSNFYYIKKNGQHMIVPHYYALYMGGEILLNEEYDDYQWVPVAEMDAFEPKIDNIPGMLSWIQRIKPILKPEDFVEI